MRALVIVSAVMLVSAWAPGRADDNSACAKFENPLEYNACLAKLGPRAGATLAVPEPAGPAAATRRLPAMRAFAGARRTGGRVRMEFTIRPR